MLNQKGMTMKELVVVLALMILMVILSIPAFFFLREYSREKQFNKTLGEVKAGIAAWHYDKLMNEKAETYPTSLGSNPSQAPCTHCFDEVAEETNDDLWFKMNDQEYYFSTNGNKGETEAYMESGDYKVTYNPATGVLTATPIQ